METEINRPLGGKAYGSIPHLAGSRVGPTDSHVHEGQECILTEKVRDRHDRIIVTEKLDGSCVSVANIEGKLVAIGRGGFPAADSPHQHIRDFSEWVDQHFVDNLSLQPGQRLVGEWMSMVHSTVYYPRRDQPLFVPFDLIEGKRRLPHDELHRVAAECRLAPAPVIHDGGPISVEDALALLGEHGNYNADLTEGCVWRCERRGEFDFIAKFVRHQKEDGKFLVDKDRRPIWLWRPGMSEAA